MKLLSIYSQRVQIEPTDEITLFIPAGTVITFSKESDLNINFPYIDGKFYETYDTRCQKMLSNLFSEMEEEIEKQIAESARRSMEVADPDKEYIGCRNKIIGPRDEDYDIINDEWN